MPIDLLSIFLTKSAEFAIGKALEVLWRCAVCSDEDDGRIKNVAYNEYECRNCHALRRQFTSACDTTIRSDGRIAHIGFLPDKPVHYATRSDDGLSWGGSNQIGMPYEYLFDGLARQQLVEVNEIVDWQSSQIVKRHNSIIVPESPLWKKSRSVSVWRTDFPPEISYGHIVAMDTRIETRFGEILFKDRILGSF